MVAYIYIPCFHHINLLSHQHCTELFNNGLKAGSQYVTQFEKTDLMAQFAQIELLVPLECAFNCASIGAIDAAISCSVAKL